LEVFITIKEIADISGVSTETVTRKINELFPGFIKNGKKTYLDKEKSIAVMESLRKIGFIEPLQNEKVALQNEKVNNEILELKLLVENMIKSIPYIVSETVKAVTVNNQLAFQQTKKYSVKEYCEMHGIKAYNQKQFQIQVGKIATSSSKNLQRSIEYKLEGDYPTGFYDEDILNHSIGMAKLNNNKQNNLFEDL
jgi:hypothetical protein